MPTKVPGQSGPYFSIGDHHGMEALQAILESQGARNLVEELHRLMMKREVSDVTTLFDIKTAGMILGPKSVIRGLVEAVKCGTADNYTFHFAMTAIVYAMALEELDPAYFKDRKHTPLGSPEGSEILQQKILDYVWKHINQMADSTPKDST